jgi:hypothetical protein
LPNSAPIKQKPNASGTVDGNLFQHSSDISTPTADIKRAKILFSSVLSTPNAKYMMIGIEDFIIPMDQDGYMRIPVIMEQYQLEHLVHNEQVLEKPAKACTAFPKPTSSPTIDSSSIAYLKIRLLAAHAPGLFTHTLHPIIFSLVVADFDVQRMGCEQARHLVDAFESLYSVTTEWPGTRYGLTLN